MRLFWLIGALGVAPLAGASENPPTLGVGELSCSKEIAEPLCSKLTERLVTALEDQSPLSVIRQADARRKQRECEQDAACMMKNRPTYERVVSGSVRASARGVEISLRLLDARRMEKLSEGSAHAGSSEEEALLEGVDSAAAELFALQAANKPDAP